MKILRNIPLFGRFKLAAYLFIIAAYTVLVIAPGTGTTGGGTLHGNGAGLTNLQGTNVNFCVDALRNLRVGTNTSDFSHASNSVYIGLYGANGEVFTGSSSVGIGDISGAGPECIVLGSGAAADSHSVAIGEQVDAFGHNNVCIGNNIVSSVEDYAIMIGGTGVGADGHTNCVNIASFMVNNTKDNQTIIGGTKTTETWVKSTSLALGGTGTLKWIFGTGSPEGAVTATKGSLYSQTDGSAAHCLWVKESDTGNTGWAFK